MYALVTGATSGIGQEIARLLAAEKYNLILVGRRTDRLIKLKEELEKENSIKAIDYTCDLSKIDECNQLIEFTKQYKDINVVINSAGFGKVGYITDMSVQEDIDMINTNVVSLHLITKHFAKTMNEGNIVNISSIAGTIPAPYMDTYGATKAYVLSFGLALGYELKKQKKPIYITTICPGPIDTEFHRVAGSKFRMPIVDAKKCAKQIIKAMKKKKRMRVIGVAAEAGYIVSRFMPMSIILFFEYIIQTKKKGD